MLDLVGAEVAVRIRHRIKYGDLWGIESTYKIDAASGLRIPIPGGSFGAIHINSLGFRGPELSTPKKSSTVRIAFIGSSTTYCAEVSSDENTWPSLVTQSVRSNWPDAHFDYVNAGIPGYTASTSTQNLRLRVAALRPDVIVIYEGYNDLSGNGLDLASKQGLTSKPTEQQMTWPSRYSLLWYLVEKNLLVWHSQRQADRTEGKLHFDREAFVAPFRHDLRELVEASKQISDTVFLVTLAPRLRRSQSVEQQKQAAVTALFYVPYMSLNNLVEAYESYNETIRKAASESGVELIEEEESIPSAAEYYADSVHFTDKGSRLMAQRVARALTASKKMSEIVGKKRSLVD